MFLNLRMEPVHQYTQSLFFITAFTAWIPFYYAGVLCKEILGLPKVFNDIIPILGLGVFGIGGYLWLFISIPYVWFVPMLLLCCILLHVFFIWRRRIKGEPWSLFCAESLSKFLSFYFIFLFFIGISPFPLLGGWSGDWLENIRLGNVVLTGNLPVELLGRTPFYPGAGAWIAYLQCPLISMQIFSAVVAASSISAFSFVYTKTTNKPADYFTLLALASSAVLLSNAAFLWAKLFAAAMVIVSVGFCIQSGFMRRTTSLAAAAIFLCMGVAAHHAMILFVVVCSSVIALQPTNFKQKLLELLLFFAFLAIGGILLVLPYEIWSISQHGLAAKIGHNPSIYYRANEPMFLTAIKTFFGTFFPFWHSLTSIVKLWLAFLFETNIANFLTASYYSLTWWTTISAGTLLLSVLPFGPFLRRKHIHHIKNVFPFNFPGVLFSILIVVILHAFLIPYASPLGSLQNGLVPVYFLVFLFLSVALEHLSPNLNSKFLFLSVFILQTLPWVLLNTIVSFLLFYIQQIDNYLFQKLINRESDFPIYVKFGFPSIAENSSLFFYFAVLFSASLLGFFTIKQSVKSTNS